MKIESGSNAFINLEKFSSYIRKRITLISIIHLKTSNFAMEILCAEANAEHLPERTPSSMAQ